MKPSSSRFFLIATVPLLALLLSVAVVEKPDVVSAHLHVRKLQKGRLLEYDLEMLCRSNGEVICHFSEPNDYFILTSPEGDLKLYNPLTRELRMTRDQVAISPGSFFYYALLRKTDDMGLPESGFSQVSSEVSEGLRITSWENPDEHHHGYKRAKDAPNRVDLVHRESSLIYMAYFLPDGRLWKKNYYHQYADCGGIQFPTAITEISYFQDRDSLTEDTRFSDIASGENANPALLHFTLPEDVIVK